MHFQATCRKPSLQRRLNGVCFRFSPAMHEPVISITAPRKVRKHSRHPDIERIMHKQITQDGADHTTLRSSSGSFNQSSVLLLKEPEELLKVVWSAPS